MLHFILLAESAKETEHIKRSQRFAKVETKLKITSLRKTAPNTAKHFAVFFKIVDWGLD